MEMIAADNSIIPLNSIDTFGPENVTLVGGSNTTYTCSYASDHYSILNITNSKSFTIQKGLLKYGNLLLFRLTALNSYFMIVNGTGGASLCLSGVEIEFVSAMNSTVLVFGGKVTFEDVKINNQLDTTWVSPLVFSHSNTSSVTVDLHSCIITNSNYKNAFSYARSAVVYFINQATATQSLTLNVSFCLCLNNSFNLSYLGSHSGGGYIYFCSHNTSSSMWFFFIKKRKGKRNLID
jgi:hypothetical protein